MQLDGQIVFFNLHSVHFHNSTNLRKSLQISTNLCKSLLISVNRANICCLLISVNRCSLYKSRQAVFSTGPYRYAFSVTHYFVLGFVPSYCVRAVLSFYSRTYHLGLLVSLRSHYSQVSPLHPLCSLDSDCGSVLCAPLVSCFVSSRSQRRVRLLSFLCCWFCSLDLAFSALCTAPLCTPCFVSTIGFVLALRARILRGYMVRRISGFCRQWVELQLQ